jgi:hypothetical protein
MQVTQDSSNIYVAVIETSSIPSWVVGYDPSSNEIYSIGPDVGSGTVTLSKTGLTQSGTYYFFLYDQYNNVVDGQTGSIVITIGGTGAGATINFSGFAKYNSSTGGCSEFSSCTVDPSVATGHVSIMNQVTIPTAGTYTIKNTFRIGGTTYNLTDSFSLSAGTKWVCSVDNGHDYAPSMAYTHVAAVFV